MLERITQRKKCWGQLNPTNKESTTSTVFLHHTSQLSREIFHKEFHKVRKILHKKQRGRRKFRQRRWQGQREGQWRKFKESEEIAKQRGQRKAHEQERSTSISKKEKDQGQNQRHTENIRKSLQKDNFTAKRIAHGKLSWYSIRIRRYGYMKISRLGGCCDSPTWKRYVQKRGLRWSAQKDSEVFMAFWLQSPSECATISQEDWLFAMMVLLRQPLWSRGRYRYAIKMLACRRSHVIADAKKKTDSAAGRNQNFTLRKDISTHVAARGACKVAASGYFCQIYHW